MAKRISGEAAKRRFSNVKRLLSVGVAPADICDMLGVDASDVSKMKKHDTYEEYVNARRAVIVPVASQPSTAPESGVGTDSIKHSLEVIENRTDALLSEFREVRELFEWVAKNAVIDKKKWR